jgi:hypothetical protein
MNNSFRAHLTMPQLEGKDIKKQISKSKSNKNLKSKRSSASSIGVNAMDKKNKLFVKTTSNCKPAQSSFH